MAKALRHGALTTAFAVVLTSCMSEAREKTPPVDDVPSSPSASQFASERHSYNLEVPPGWEATEYDGTWTDFSQFSPGAEVPGEDVVSSPDDSAFLVSNSMAIPDGMSPEEWLSEFDRLISEGTDPKCAKPAGTEEIAGEQAHVIDDQCGSLHIVGRNLTHDGRGYYFTIGFPSADPETEATLEGIVASIGFD